MAQVEGSGTTEPVSENAALNGPWRADIRADAQPVGIERCVAGPALQVGEPNGKGPGAAMIGFGADSQKKSPSSEIWTWGTKK